MLFDAGGVALCVWLFDGEFVWAWFAGGLAELEGWVVWAWEGALLDGACALFVLVPVEAGACAELDEEAVVWADGPAVVEDWVELGDADGVGVTAEFCCVVVGAELDVLGADWAKADVAIATAAVVARNSCLFI